jgi:hypothetical protein
MWQRQLALHGLALLLVLTACALRQQSADPAACRSLDGAGLQHCLDQLPDGAQLSLAPGRYVLTQALELHRPVTLTTRGAPDCAQGGCAVLALRLPPSGNPFLRAVTVSGAGSVLAHLTIEGGKADPARDDTRTCAGPGRPSMGGLAITAPSVTVRDSVITQVACYSAVVADAGARGLRFERNLVLSNGTHDRPAMWADGLTVIDGVDDAIRGNVFRDNTDVQLVLGGCRNCTVADNTLDETAAPGAGAFAGLLVHAWPATSGDYTGTIITGNHIDCGPARRCGFGIGVGGRAWYQSPTSGGRIVGNSVTRAEIGINVDDATGPVAMADNTVTVSGGPVRSRCGLWLAGPVNISAASRRYVDATAGVKMPAEAVTDRTFRGCLPGLS